MPVRVRFAPSPTGELHIGGVRTALFNFLFARHEGGEFLLRIEDTDKERSQKKFEEAIFDGLRWLGLDWDNKKITRQSERLEIYEKYLVKLLEEKKAYYCFCSPEELESERQAQLSQGMPPKYGGRCRNLPEDEVKKRLKNQPAVIRFKTAEKTVAWNDIIRGRIEINAGLMGDTIIAKSLREPLYNFAVVIDDHDMEITHVIRGEEHISNTPKQILLQEALEFNHPHYAHLPLILGQDHKKLSKRYAENSFNDYKLQGYLPEAIINFLALLGWHPEQDREVLSLEELIKEFSLKRVQKAGAVFNPEKLDWLNAYYIKEKSDKELLEYLSPFVPPAWFKEKEKLSKVMELEKERIKRLDEFSGLAKFFFELADYKPELLVWQKAPKAEIMDNLAATFGILEKIPADGFSKEIIEKSLLELSEKRGRGEVFWPLRTALSGLSVSPPPTEIASVLGKKETLERINAAIAKLDRAE